MDINDDEIKVLDKNGLRKFGLTMAVVIITLFGLIIPYFIEVNFSWWPWVVGLLFFASSITAPLKLKMVYHSWMKFGFILHKVTSPIILGLIFFAIFFPVACIMKLINRDSMKRKIDYSFHTYRITSQKRSKKSMERPF